jgi:hypothetical protein
MEWGSRVARRLSAVAAASALAVTGASSGWAQEKSSNIQKQIVGTWALVSAENARSDGTKSLAWGKNPKGMAVFTTNGRFMILNTNPDGQMKFASNSRANGTAEENKAAVLGSLALYGTYKVIDKDKTIIFNIEASSYPNWNGAEQKRPINTLTADQLTWTNPAASTGGASTLLVWKRIK